MPPACYQNASIFPNIEPKYRKGEWADLLWFWFQHMMKHSSHNSGFLLTTSFRQSGNAVRTVTYKVLHAILPDMAKMIVDRKV